MASLEMSKALQEQLRNAEDLKKDIRTARGIINNAMKQYIKRKIGARNKAQVEDQDRFYAALDDYSSKEEIRTAYGWEFISEGEMYRLMDMWDAREAARANNGQYADRVTEMLVFAMRAIDNPYIEEIAEAEEAHRRHREEEKRIQRENTERDWERKNGLRI